MIEMRVSLEVLALTHPFARLTTADLRMAEDARIACDAAEGHDNLGTLQSGFSPGNPDTLRNATTAHRN